MNNFAAENYTNMVLNKDYKQDITIRNYSAYMKDEYSTMFRKLYKGVVVRVSPEKNNPQFCWFTVKTKKLKNTIYKTPKEKMYSIVFNDSDCSITCNFERYEKNRGLDSLSFEKEVYDELKSYIPEFMVECECGPKDIIENESELKLVF